LALESLAFYAFGAVAVTASLLVIGQRNTFYSVLLLIASFGALAGLYVLLDAPFVAVTQIIVYAGAIMVLFLFVVMLLNAPPEPGQPRGRPGEGGNGSLERLPLPGTRAMWFGALLAMALAGELAWALMQVGETGEFGPASVSSVRAIGRILFTDYAFAFEVTSVLILVAMVGAVVLARREPKTGRR
jgi:NADH-quinone oxidoreductase subunit J